jgi:hypothetical protein
VAITCAIIREKFLVPALEPLAGKALGTLLAAAVILGLIFLYVGKLKDPSRVSLFKLGVYWTVLTIAFECLFGHYVMGLAWESLGAEYNVFRGKLWPLVLLVTWFGPLLAKKIRGHDRVRQPA